MWRNVWSWIGWVLGVIAVVIGCSLFAGNLLADEPDATVDRQLEGHSFTAEHEVLPTDDGGADLRITETIVVSFSGSDRHGIIRDIPLDYAGHSSRLEAVEVQADDLPLPTDLPAWGQVPYEVTEEAGLASIRIGDAYETLLPGPHAYRISYVLTDVPLNIAGGQEIYINVNGNEWATGFDTVEAKVTVPESLAERLNGDTACYQGRQDSEQTCELRVDETGDATVVTATATRPLEAFEGLTYAVGFTPDTFADADTPRTVSTSTWVWFALPMAYGLVFLLVALLRRWAARPRSASDTVEVRFEPPAGISPMAAADVWGTPERGPTAELLDAVLERQAVIATTVAVEDSYAPAGPHTGLSEREERGFRESIEIQGLREIADPDRRAFLMGYFPSGRIDPLHVPDDAIEQHRRNVIVRLGLRRATGGSGRWFLNAYLGLLVLTFFTTFALYLPGELPRWLIWISPTAGALLLIASVFLLPGLGKLTPKGRQVRDELRGLERFMSMAEQDRIAWLQGIRTAPRERHGDGSRIALYERLLPYAVIFGMEASWAELVESGLGAQGSVWSLRDASLDLGRLLVSFSSTRRSTRRSLWSGRNTLSGAGRSLGKGLESMAKNAGSGRRSGGSRRGGSRGGGRSGGGRGGGGGRSW